MSTQKAHRPARLLVHWSPPEAAWLTLDRSGQPLAGGRVPLDEVDTLPTADECWVLANAGQFTPMVLDLPEMSKHRLAQAVVWAAEEHVAGAIEHEHIVSGERDPSGRLKAVAVAHSTMDDWSKAMASLSPDVLMPDAMCLPWTPETVSLAQSNDGILMRWGGWNFGVFSPKAAELMLDQWPGQPLFWFGSAPPPTQLEERVERAAGDHAEAELLVALKDQALASKLNVLTGPYKPQRAFITQAHWRWVAGLALGVGVLFLATLGIEQLLLSHKAETLRAQVQTQFQTLFPNQPAVGRERELIAREMAKLQYGQAAGLLELLARVQPVIAASGGVSVNTLNYESGELVLALAADDVASLDRVARQLMDLSLQATVESASLSSKGAEGRVRISMGDS